MIKFGHSEQQQDKKDIDSLRIVGRRSLSSPPAPTSSAEVLENIYARCILIAVEVPATEVEEELSRGSSFSSPSSSVDTTTTTCASSPRRACLTGDAATDELQWRGGAN